ncbi:acyl-oxidase [Moniliophthora roreri]|nr:acyl-oxidase [Moniliophthora roreri]
MAFSKSRVRTSDAPAMPGSDGGDLCHEARFCTVYAVAGISRRDQHRMEGVALLSELELESSRKP